MKATAATLTKYLTKSFAAAAFLAVALQGADASQDHQAEAGFSTEINMPQLLGGLMLAKHQGVVAAEPFQFGSDFDGYGLVARTATEAEEAPAGVDPMKTAAIIPGVFGSVAIPMRNFPVASRWAKVYRDISGCTETTCGKNGAALYGLAEDSRDSKFLDKLAVVNRAVNTMIAYRKDQGVYGNLDYWAKPTEILSRGAGDCEDFAILKMSALIDAGVPAQSMSLVILQDASRGVFHAVLSVATQSGTFILDNLSNKVMRDDALKSYVPLYSFSTNRAWIHGARPGTGQIAAATENFAAIAPGEGPAPQ